MEVSRYSALSIFLSFTNLSKKQSSNSFLPFFLPLTGMLFFCFFISSITGIRLGVVKQNCFNSQGDFEGAEKFKKETRNLKGHANPPGLTSSSQSPEATESHSVSQSPTKFVEPRSGSVARSTTSTSSPVQSNNEGSLPLGLILGIAFGVLVLVVLVFGFLWVFLRRRASNEGSLTHPINFDTENGSVDRLKNTESKSSREGVDIDSGSGSSSSVMNFQGDFEESKV
jgi:hypothetical protein